MKKIIITLSVAGFISLGFTVVGSNTNSKEESAITVQNAGSEKHSGINDSNDKRLASWD
jgi:ABC-type molybdate transport system substrate-binding protein